MQFLIPTSLSATSVTPFPHRVGTPEVADLDTSDAKSMICIRYTCRQLGEIGHCVCQPHQQRLTAGAVMHASCAGLHRLFSFTLPREAIHQVPMYTSHVESGRLADLADHALVLFQPLSSCLLFVSSILSSILFRHKYTFMMHTCRTMFNPKPFTARPAIASAGNSGHLTPTCTSRQAAQQATASKGRPCQTAAPDVTNSRWSSRTHPAYKLNRPVQTTLKAAGQARPMRVCLSLFPTPSGQMPSRLQSHVPEDTSESKQNKLGKRKAPRRASAHRARHLKLFVVLPFYARLGSTVASQLLVWPGVRPAHYEVLARDHDEARGSFDMCRAETTGA